MARDAMSEIEKADAPRTSLKVGIVCSVMENVYADEAREKGQRMADDSCSSSVQSMSHKALLEAYISEIPRAATSAVQLRPAVVAAWLPSTTMSRLACLSRSTMSSISSEHLSRVAVAVAEGCVLVVEECGSLYASHPTAQLSLSVPHHRDSYRRRADIVIPSVLDWVQAQR